MKLKIKGTYMVSLTKYPGEQESTQVMVLAGILTPPVAEKLRIREGCSNEEGVPRHYESCPSPSVRIAGADVMIGDTQYRATLLHKFKISQPKTGGEADTSLEIRFRVHFSGKVPLHAVVDNLLNSEFVFGINAAQEDFNFGDDEKAAEEPEEEEAQQDLLPADAAPALASVREMGSPRSRKKEPVGVQ